jgi:hypothetical protein
VLGHREPGVERRFLGDEADAPKQGGIMPPGIHRGR